MVTSSSSLDKSPLREDGTVTPDSVPMTVTSIITDSLQFSPSSKQSSESWRRKSTSVSLPTDNSPTPVKSRWSFSSSKKSFGSRDETFFDSHQWLQSDSDDDFYSVNGDFTPSRGSTPKSSFSSDRTRSQSRIFQDSKPPRGPSSLAPPQLRRKKLFELFRDSIREERGESSQGSSPPTPPNYLSRGEFNNTTVVEDSFVKKNKSNWQHQRCLPGFSSCGRSFM